MMRRMFRGLVKRAAEGDTEALEALARLERVASAATTVALTKSAKQHGGRYSWAELADVAGTTRQAIGQRIGRRHLIPAELLGFLTKS